MILEPICFKRKCKHYLGIYQPNGTEIGEVPYCEAFEHGIPDEILSGENKHIKPLKDQENNVVFDKLKT